MELGIEAEESEKYPLGLLSSPFLMSGWLPPNVSILQQISNIVRGLFKESLEVPPITVAPKPTYIKEYSSFITVIKLPVFTQG